MALVYYVWDRYRLNGFLLTGGSPNDILVDIRRSLSGDATVCVLDSATSLMVNGVELYETLVVEDLSRMNKDMPDSLGNGIYNRTEKGEIWR